MKNARLGDPGLAVEMKPDQDHHTATDGLIGTLPFMDPDMNGDRRYTENDIFSYGVGRWFMSTYLHI